jgi:molecular chaperone DnaJ
LLRLPITYPQAALGALVEVPTLDGLEELKVPAGTQPGDIFRLRGHGMPDPRGGRRGDLLVQTFLEVPKKLGAREQELLRELAEIERVEVSPQRKSFLETLRGYFAPTVDDDPANED